MDLLCINHQPERLSSQTCSFVFVAFTSAASWMFDKIHVRHRKPRNGMKGSMACRRIKDEPRIFKVAPAYYHHIQSACRSGVDHQLQDIVSLAIIRCEAHYHNNSNSDRNLLPSAAAAHRRSCDWLGRYTIMHVTMLAAIQSRMCKP